MMIKGLLDRFVSPVQQSYRSGNLFGGGTQLEKLLGEDVRRQAQKQAITQLGMGLLGQGPSRTPIRTSASLGQGLLGAQQAYQKSLGSQLQQAAAIKALGKPDYIKIKDEDGREILFDPVSREKIDPFAVAGAGVSETIAPSGIETVGLGGDLSPEEIREAPTVREAAQGDLGGLLTTGARRGLGFVGIETGGEAAKARDYVFNTNKEMQVALTKDLGGRFTKVVADTIKEIMPTPNMVDADFRSKAIQLVKFSNERIAEVKSKMPSLNRKERKEAQSYIDEVSRQVRKYEAMLAKNNTSPVPSAISNMSNDELRIRAGLSAI